MGRGSDRQSRRPYPWQPWRQPPPKPLPVTQSVECLLKLWGWGRGKRSEEQANKQKVTARNTLRPSQSGDDYWLTLPKFHLATCEMKMIMSKYSESLATIIIFINNVINKELQQFCAYGHHLQTMKSVATLCHQNKNWNRNIFILSMQVFVIDVDNGCYLVNWLTRRPLHSKFITSLDKFKFICALN